MITDMDANRFRTRSLHDPRILRILAAALDAVDPYVAVQKNLPNIKGRVFGLGIGKAALPPAPSAPGTRARCRETSSTPTRRRPRMRPPARSLSCPAFQESE